MKFAIAQFSNLWYVAGREVDNIIFFDNLDGGRILLDTKSKWIGYGYGGNAITTLDDVEEVKLRRTVDLSRVEHFYTAIKANKYSGTAIVLYLNAALFHGASTVNKLVNHSDEFQTVYRNCLEISAKIDKGADPVWIKVWAGGQQYEIVTSPLGELCDKVAEIVNDTVTDHANRAIGRTQAHRLIKTMPNILNAVKASGLNL